jgi:hypothetical protein
VAARAAEAATGKTQKEVAASAAGGRNRKIDKEYKV